MDLPFRRTLAPLADRSAIIALTTSGFTVLPWNYDAATAPPTLDRLVNAGDFTKPVAPGGLVSIFGSGTQPHDAGQHRTFPCLPCWRTPA